MRLRDKISRADMCPTSMLGTANALDCKTISQFSHCCRKANRRISRDPQSSFRRQGRRLPSYPQQHTPRYRQTARPRGSRGPDPSGRRLRNYDAGDVANCVSCEFDTRCPRSIDEDVGCGCEPGAGGFGEARVSRECATTTPHDHLPVYRHLAPCPHNGRRP